MLRLPLYYSNQSIFVSKKKLIFQPFYIIDVWEFGWELDFQPFHVFQADFLSFYVYWCLRIQTLKHMEWSKETPTLKNKKLSKDELEHWETKNDQEVDSCLNS
jgi:hypothetical protein